MEEHHADDQSHYEISLTAAQAFLAFVLLLLSLSATFAFGLMIGRGQADERLVVRRDVPIVTEGSVLAPKKAAGSGEIVELGVRNEDFQDKNATVATDSTSTDPVVIEEATATAAATADVTQPKDTPAPPPAATTEPAPKPVAAAPKPVAPAPQPAATPVVKPESHAATAHAQLLSTTDQRRAEALAAKLIEAKFMGAYVERGSSDRGPIYRVRVRFPSEADARGALPRLKEFSADVWVDVR